ncbi:uncharacterized protein LOC122500729 [Leptopilina heterotoma]|uniref:uncharacterized protein LOC122500729 n=1 Tax=Leptopilina heterotoma TaxID=63436 RepID=UPI001CA91C37|nr:uncharacterized protein LOC122500729 [Leptopilina heterotoma]
MDLETLTNFFNGIETCYHSQRMLLRKNSTILDSSDYNQKVSIPVKKAGLCDYAVNDIFRLGKKSENQIRPVLIKFTGTRWLKLIFTNIKYFKSLKLVVTNDYSKEERHERKILK